MSRGKHQEVIHNFDDFVEAAGLLPDDKREIVWAVDNPLELHFMQVADKHGVIDEILDPDFDAFEP